MFHTLHIVWASGHCLYHFIFFCGLVAQFGAGIATAVLASENLSSTCWSSHLPLIFFRAVGSMPLIVGAGIIVVFEAAVQFCIHFFCSDN